MDAGIVGLPYVGKTTLFNALVAEHAPADAHQIGGIRPHVGVVPVPDPRLEILARYIKTQRVVPASLKLVDVPGLARGASAGAGLGNRFLAHIRNVDALVHVVRCFENPDVPHVEGSIDPVRDVETVQTELMLADLEQIEGMLDKARRSAKSGDREAKLRLEFLEAGQKALSEGRPLSTLLNEPAFGSSEARNMLKALAFLTTKPVVYVANVGEADPAGSGPMVQKLRQKLAGSGAPVVAVCAELEEELSELEESERGPMLQAMGLSEPAIAVLARAILQVLGLECFFTVGPKEIHAWTIPQGTVAPRAAGAVHSDFERGFIKVEVFRVEDLEQYKSEQAIRAAGRLRVEGKNYVVRDGDVCHFLFHV